MTGAPASWWDALWGGTTFAVLSMLVAILLVHYVASHRRDDDE